MEFVSEDYLPNSAEKIEHLRRIINGRPVAILAAGPSIQELEERIYELTDTDICYFGLNSFIVQEANILNKIDKRLSVLLCGGREGIPNAMKDIVEFLDRDEDNIFISSFCRDTFGLMDDDFDLHQFLNKYDRKLVFHSTNREKTVPNRNEPLHFMDCNSLLSLIQMAIIGKASKVVLFGADGGCRKDAEEWYYRQRDPRHRGVVAGKWGSWILPPNENLIHDTNRFFNPVAPIAIRNIYKTYNLAPIDILNCSENSFYAPFPKVSYDDAFENLLYEKKFNLNMDLRIPKVSVISKFLDHEEFLRETIDNISNQSYSNHEHIIVYDESDDKTRAIIQQFPHIRWIPEKNIETCQVLGTGISEAKGDYIFLCRIGDGYLNDNWINSCVEVLENNSDISLVWGLSQSRLRDGALVRIRDAHYFNAPPQQAESYIHYWLNEKSVFPEDNCCVRKSVFEKCFPFDTKNDVGFHNAWISFNYHFNTSGYLPQFFPTVSTYCRYHSPEDQGGVQPMSKGGSGYLPYFVSFIGNNIFKGQNKGIRDEERDKTIKLYYSDIKQYKRLLVKGKITHQFRNGSGGIFSTLPNTGRRIKRWQLLQRALDYWRIYRWDVIRVGTVKVWHRLKKRWK